MDIWALCALIHEVLTSEIPRPDPVLSISDSDNQSMPSVTESSLDGKLLMDFYAGRSSFPVAGVTMRDRNRLHNDHDGPESKAPKLGGGRPAELMADGVRPRCSWIYARPNRRRPCPPITGPAVGSSIGAELSTC